MDTTFIQYKKMNYREGLERILKIMARIKEVNGTCYALWHNDTFTERHDKKGWRRVFETVAQEAAKMEKE